MSTETEDLRFVDRTFVVSHSHAMQLLHIKTLSKNKKLDVLFIIDLASHV